MVMYRPPRPSAITVAEVAVPLPSCAVAELSCSCGQTGWPLRALAIVVIVVALGAERNGKGRCSRDARATGH